MGLHYVDKDDSEKEAIQEEEDFFLWERVMVQLIGVENFSVGEILVREILQRELQISLGEALAYYTYIAILC